MQKKSMGDYRTGSVVTPGTTTLQNKLHNKQNIKKQKIIDLSTEDS